MTNDLPIPAELHALAGQTALERAKFWTKRGCVAQAQAEISRALQENEPATRVGFGLFLREHGDWSAAVVQFQRLLDYAQRSCDVRLQAIALNNLAVLHREAGMQSIAVSFQQRSFDAESAGDKPNESGLGLACDLSNLANDALLAGEYRSALRLLTSALQVDLQDDGNLDALAADWGSLGLANLLEGRFADALRCLKRSLHLHRQLNDPRGMVCNMLHLSQFWATLGAWSRAERHIERAIGILRDLPHGELHEEAQAWLKLTRRQRRVWECDPLCN